MSEFFSSPPHRSSSEHEADRRVLEEQQRKARIALERQASHLPPALEYLAQELIDRGIKPEARLIRVAEGDLSRGAQYGRKLGNWAMRHAQNWTEPVQRPMVKQATQEVTTGWPVSVSRSQARTIVLDKNATLHMGEGITVDRLVDGGVVDLAVYPFHPHFESKLGYASTYSKIPLVTEAKLTSYTSAEALVGINLEQLAEDVRTFARNHDIDGR